MISKRGFPIASNLLEIKKKHKWNGNQRSLLGLRAHGHLVLSGLHAQLQQNTEVLLSLAYIPLLCSGILLVLVLQ